MLYIDPGYLFFVFPALILAMYAQFKVQATYQQFSRVHNSGGYSALLVARTLLNDAGLENIPIERVAGRMTDHYDPRNRVLRLSEGTINSTSVAALGIAAHEVGHAIQHENGYIPLRLRNTIYPVANLGSRMAIPLFVIGLIFNSGFLMEVGIMFFGFAFLFQLVTLPVEFNASRRADRHLTAGGYLTYAEADGSRKVLKAAALTYVAGTIMALAQLLRLVMLAGRRD